MKKLMALLIALMLLVPTLAACGESVTTVPTSSTNPSAEGSTGKDPDTGNPSIDLGLGTTLNGKELTQLLLAQERLNAGVLRDTDNIFASGESVLQNLAAVAAANLVYAAGKATVVPLSATEKKVYTPGGGGKLTVSGDTYTWSEFPAYSNSYSYFENLTSNIIYNAKQGAEMIDEFKKNVRVVGKWVSYDSEERLLLVDENSETLVWRYTEDNDSNVYVTRRYKNEEGLNVYEIIHEGTSPDFETFTRFLYIPDLRCEYVHYSLTNGTEYFDHNFYANKEKGYWEVIDTNGRQVDHVNLSYMALKDDIFYDIILNVTENETTPAFIKIMTPDRKYDLAQMDYFEAADSVTLNLSLQSYEGVKNLQAVIPADQIGKGDEGFNMPIVFYEEDGIMINYSSDYPCYVNLTNGKRLNVGDTFVDGTVTVVKTIVAFFASNDTGYIHVADMSLRIMGDTYEEQMTRYKAFLEEVGMTPYNSTPDYVIAGITRALEEVKQFCAWGMWNGHSVSSEAELRKGYAVEDAYEAAYKEFYASLQDIESIKLNDQETISLNIKFSPVTLGEGSIAKYENGTVTVNNLSLTATDTTLFVEGEPYIITLAMISTDKNGTQGLIHVCELTENGTAYVKAGSFSLTQAELTFKVPGLLFGTYTVVAYISTADGIRTSQYIPIGFTEVLTEKVSLGDIEVHPERAENGEIVLHYIQCPDVYETLEVSENTVPYTTLYNTLASFVLQRGIIPEDAVVEVYDEETDSWTAITEAAETVELGRYRLAYDATNGAITVKGYIIIDLIQIESDSEADVDTNEPPVDPNGAEDAPLIPTDETGSDESVS